MKDLFEEIDELKEDLPKLKAITKEVQKNKYNGYQIIAIVTFIIFFIIGIIVGNVVPACESTGIFGNCDQTQFNLSLTIIIWFISFLVAVFFYGIGHIIQLLTEISAKMCKK